MLFGQSGLAELSINDIDTLCQHYLDILYQDIQLASSSASQPSPDQALSSTEPKVIQKNSLATSDICQTYGEVLYSSIDKLLSVIQPSAQDVFVDYGSGLGKIVIQVFLKSLVKEAYGIEIIPKLYQQSMQAAQRLAHELPIFYQNGRKLSFLLGNFLETPSLGATIGMMTSTCFTQTLLNQLGKIIEETPSVHTVLSLRPLGQLTRLVFKKTIRIECSWDSALCYVYRDPNSTQW